MQPDNKILAGGTSDTDFALVRYNLDGSLDTTFGSSGIVIDAQGQIINDLAVQIDTKIIAVGILTTVGTSGIIIRYTSSGERDSSFGSNGVVIATDQTEPSSDISLQAVQIQKDGKILVAGTITGATTRIFVARYLSDGNIDTSFGTNGIQKTLIGTISDGQDVAIQSDNKIVVLATSTVSGNNDFTLARYNEDGSLDASFGNNGIMSNTGFAQAIASRLTLQTDGKIVAAGRSPFAGPSASFALARYNINGSLDSSFGQSGTGRISNLILGSASFAFDVAINSIGKIIASGSSSPLTAPFMALAQYQVNSLHYGTLSQALWQRYYNQNIKVKNQ